MKNSRYLFFLEDRPPLQALLALGAQHALLAMVFLIYPLAVAQALRLDSASTLTLLTASLVGIGIATCLHCIKRPFGSGSLAVEIPTPVFLPIALFAGSTGGVGALAGVTMLCGAVGLLFGTLLQRFRGLFPPEVCGVAVFMLGISIIRPGMLNSFDITDPTGDIRLAPLAVAITTLVVMTLISVIGKRRAKMLALFGGILTGVILSILLGLLRLEHWRSISEVPMWSWPSLSLIRPSMDLSMVPLAVLMAVIASVDNLGMLVGIQRQGNPSWQKLDVSQASVGLKVSSIGDLLSGMFGGMPTGISSANLGLAHATGAVSRVIALMAGSLLLATAFMPQLVSAIAVLPRPIIGAIVLYTAIYMVVSGISLILNRVLNDRRVFVIGFSIVMGIASASMPTLFDQAPVVLRPILESPLATGVLSAILLNHLLSLGTTLRTSLALDLGPGESELVQEYKVNQSLRHALQEPAGELALAKVFVDRAVDVTSELVAALKIGGYIKGKVELFTRIDEDRIEVSVSYEGLPAPVSGLDDQKSNPGMGADWESTNLAKTFSQVDRVITSSSSHQQRLTLRYEN